MSHRIPQRPPPSDLVGLPIGDYYTHDFPRDIPAGTKIQLTISGLEKQLLNFSEGGMAPDQKKKQREKKQRRLDLVLVFSHKIRPIRLFFDKNARIAFVYGKRDSPIVVGPEILKPCESQLLTFYNKPKKRKILNACFFDAGHPVTDIHRAMDSCKALLAVDTNYKTVPGIGIVAATTALTASTRAVSSDACYTNSTETRQVITIDPPGNPELYGIWVMLQHYLDTNPELRRHELGLITDTEFGLVEAINRRQQPIFGNNLLPNNAKLFYATADSGSMEFIPNLLIRECDKASTRHLNSHLSSLKKS